jgi:hypothetical protein
MLLILLLCSVVSSLTLFDPVVAPGGVGVYAPIHEPSHMFVLKAYSAASRVWNETASPIMLPVGGDQSGCSIPAGFNKSSLFGRVLLVVVEGERGRLANET